ncbi:MAG: hypothetical protein WA160_10610 [Pseudobdellovibrio sp.]
MKSVKLTLILISALVTFGCKGANYLNAGSQINSIPTVFENPSAAPDAKPDEVTENAATDPEKTAPVEEAPAKPESVIPVVTPPQVPQKPAAPVLSKPSEFIKNAEMIMLKEGKKIGTPCNMYVLRVLVVSGFPNVSFLATDFDLYAKKNLGHFRAIDFKSDASKSDIARLKQHIWSYPERTPFIAQWSRSSGHGHIAIIERIKDSLIIYQASLNQHSAQREQTTPEIMIDDSNRRVLTLYSEFTK